MATTFVCDVPSRVGGRAALCKKERKEQKEGKRHRIIAGVHSNTAHAKFKHQITKYGQCVTTNHGSHANADKRKREYEVNGTRKQAEAIIITQR
jgi:hypothetical protein